MQTIPIMFRFYQAEVTAVVPTLPYDPSRGSDLTAYSQLGQHGVAAWEWIAQMRPASEEEYGPLLTELQRI
jgi:hypothetical protein